MNNKIVVHDAPLENFWKRDEPILPTGPIQLQTHGGEMRFRNIFIREIPAEEANEILRNRHPWKGPSFDFKSLFNGKDMTGWIGDVNSYEATKDGCLYFKPGTKDNIYTAEEYDNFILRFEFKLTPAGNNGVAIRSPIEGKSSYAGMEVQILDDGHEKYKGWLLPYQFHGAVYGISPAHRGYLRPAGEWNYMEIIADGPRIQVFTNGTKVNDVDLSQAKPIDGEEHPGMHRPSGHIGFLGHEDAVWFRNIAIRRLPATQ